MRTLFLFLLALHSGSLLAFSTSDDETDTTKTIYLNNVVVVIAQRDETNTFDRSESIGFLNKPQLDFLSPMSAPQALSYVPGVWMQKTNHGGGSAFIRGLTGYQTLLMIDGVRMNNSTYRSGPNQYLNTIDPLMISSVEVLRGNGSVQYGSDAIGGTIQMLSADPVFAESGVKVSGRIYGKYWSSDMERSGRAELNIGSKNFALYGGFSYKNLGDITAGGDLGVLEPTGYAEYSADIKAIYKVGSGNRFVASYQHLKQRDVPLYHKLYQDEYQRYHFDPQRRDLAYLKFISHYQNKFISKISYTLSYQNSLEIREKQKTGSVDFVKEGDEINTVGLNVEVVSNFSDNWKATSGVEYYHDHVGSWAESGDVETGSVTALRGLYPDGSKYDNLAFFSLHQIETGRFNFSGGLRYNFIALQLEDTVFGNTSITPDALVSNAGIVYKLNDHHHCYYSTAKGLSR
jgi:iron complex outermembrane receptor protein/hemoglobin/transferrin/lactoferrin receptor protein